jgi:hypothetical protein
MERIAVVNQKREIETVLLVNVINSSLFLEQAKKVFIGCDLFSNNDYALVVMSFLPRMSDNDKKLFNGFISTLIRLMIIEKKVTEHNYPYDTIRIIKNLKKIN